MEDRDQKKNVGAISDRGMKKTDVNDIGYKFSYIYYQE